MFECPLRRAHFGEALRALRGCERRRVPGPTTTPASKSPVPSSDPPPLPEPFNGPFRLRLNVPVDLRGDVFDLRGCRIPQPLQASLPELVHTQMEVLPESGAPI